jgi:hypothetical protein
MTIATISVLSEEAVRVLNVKGTGVSNQLLATYTVEMAFPATGVSPTQWYTATWDTSTDPNNYAATVVIGPSSSGPTLTVGTYDVWVRVTGGGIRPVVNAGQLSAV